MLVSGNETIEKKEDKYILQTKVLNENFNIEFPSLTINIQGTQSIPIKVGDKLMFTEESNSYLLNKDNLIIGKFEKNFSNEDFGVLFFIFYGFIAIVGGTLLIGLLIGTSSVPMG